MRNIAEAALKEHRVLILLDGLDEVKREEYSSVADRIDAFIGGHCYCKVIITSRKSGFKWNHPYLEYEIDQLPFAEIQSFINKWLGTDSDLVDHIRTNNRIYELARNPFLLSIICFIFEKDHDLPERRVVLYKKSTVTLLTLYDEIKPVARQNMYTRYLKEQVLEDLAYYFFMHEKNEFAYDSLVKCVSKTLKRIDRAGNEEDKILREICENSGLLQKSDDNFMFVHRTFFEYYVSRKMRTETQEQVLSRAKQPRWEEPIRLYAAQIEPDDEGKTEGTQLLQKLWELDNTLALRCYPDMDNVVEAELIRNLFYQADVNARVELVKGIPEKIEDPEKLVETLDQLFHWETNGEVLYWGVQILEQHKKTPGALEVVRKKLDKGAKARYKKYVKRDMVRIPEGTFMMGGDEESYEQPIHEVHVNEFYVHRYQVTNWLYEEFDPNHRQRRDIYSSEDNQPVIYVNWYEAVIFCRWLGCRLPSEAEWEYASRADTTTPFNTGDNLTTDQANYDGNYPYRDYPKGEYIKKTTPVGNYPANDWGLHDMHGNVWEWCQDNWHRNYEGAPGDGSAWEDEKSSYRVLRGGSWYNSAQYCRSAYRFYDFPGYRYDNFGFRLVFVP